MFDHSNRKRNWDTGKGCCCVGDAPLTCQSLLATPAYRQLGAGVFWKLPNSTFQTRFSRAMSVFFMFDTIARDISEFKYPHMVMMKNSSIILWLTYIKMSNMGHQWGWNGTWRGISSIPDRETESLDSFSKPTQGSLLQLYRVFCGKKKGYLTYHLPGPDKGSILVQENKCPIKRTDVEKPK